LYIVLHASSVSQVRIVEVRDGRLLKHGWKKCVVCFIKHFSN